MHTYGSLCKTLGSAKLPLVDLWVIGRIQPPVKKYPGSTEAKIIRVRHFHWLILLMQLLLKSLWVIKFDSIFSLYRSMMQSYLLVLLSSLAFSFSFMDIHDSVTQLWIIKFTGNFTLWIHDVHNCTRFTGIFTCGPMTLLITCVINFTAVWSMTLLIACVINFTAIWSMTLLITCVINFTGIWSMTLLIACVINFTGIWSMTLLIACVINFTATFLGKILTLSPSLWLIFIAEN